MITGLSHAHVWCLDQDSARAFYTEKLGFVVRTDALMESGFRWITVHAPAQPDVVLVLGAIGPPMIAPQAEQQVRELVASGAFGVGVLRTDDCVGTHRELSAKGVEFIQAPEPRPYGTEAVFRDDSGNWFSLTEAAVG